MQEETKNADLAQEVQDKKGKNLYILEAALEYFISLTITGAYLAKITSAIGMSQGLTGILTAFVSLGYVFQIFALFLAGKRKVKGFITILHMINQLCFALIYLVPLVNVPTALKHGFFIVFLLIGYIVSNLIGAPKLGWYMTFVKDKERGEFTAKKEMVSLVGGMIYSYLLSFVIDHFEAVGQLNVAFIISAISIFLLALAHTLNLLATPAVELPVNDSTSNFKNAVKTVFRNRRVLKVLVIASAYNVISSGIIAFYGAYTISMPEKFGLGFSMQLVAAFSIIGAFVRVLFSRPIGRFADKYSFKNSSILCYSLLALALLMVAFAVPANGTLMYALYVVIHAVAMAGVNSGMINLLYEEVQPEQRMCAFAVQQTISGLVGFSFAILSGVFVDWVQKMPAGQFCGMFAQQWLSLVGVLICVFVVLFIQFCMKKKKTE